MKAMIRRHSSRWSLGAAAALILAVPSLEAGTLEQRALDRLEDARMSEHGEIQVDVEDGQVRLSGFVTTVHAWKKAEDAVRKETENVDNLLEVLPVEELTDLELRKKLVGTILGYPQLTVFDSIELGLRDGHVLLAGSVHQPYRKDAVEARVTKVEGVRSIRSEIEVQSVSAYDERLRYQVARAIYRDPRFVQYAGSTNPPIRIVVDKGQITLTGSVSSSVEQVALGHIARGLVSFGVDNRVLVDGDAKAEVRTANAVS